MLILVAVTITVAVNGGLFKHAGQATGETKNAINEEQQLASGRINIDGVWYDSMQDYVDEKPSADQSGTSGGTSGGEGESGSTEEPPATQAHVWEKYSVTLTFLNASATSYSEGSYGGEIVRYACADFPNNNSFTVSNEWRGTLADWLNGMYKNYPFAIPTNNVNYTMTCTCTLIRNTSGLAWYKGYEFNGNSNIYYIYYDTYPNGLEITYKSKGSYLYGTVTSTDSTTYPTDGVKDGCWYVYKGLQ